MISRAELSDLADVRFAEVVEELKRATPDMDAIERAGVVSAVLIATGITLACHHGAPRDVVEMALLEKIAEIYEANEEKI